MSKDTTSDACVRCWVPNVESWLAVARTWSLLDERGYLYFMPGITIPGGEIPALQEAVVDDVVPMRGSANAGHVGCVIS